MYFYMEDCLGLELDYAGVRQVCDPDLLDVSTVGLLTSKLAEDREIESMGLRIASEYAFYKWSFSSYPRLLRKELNSSLGLGLGRTSKRHSGQTSKARMRSWYWRGELFAKGLVAVGAVCEHLYWRDRGEESYSWKYDLENNGIYGVFREFHLRARSRYQVTGDLTYQLAVRGCGRGGVSSLLSGLGILRWWDRC